MTVWKPVVGYEHAYEVSDEGQVRRIAFTDDRGRTWGGFVMKNDVNSKGYQRVQLVKDGEKHKVSVHAVVLEAFVGLRPDGHEARHLDSDPGNNRADNLAWGTRAQNNADRMNNGTYYKGADHPMAKIDEDLARQVKYVVKGSAPAVAQMLGVTTSIVNNIRSGKVWKHL